MKKLLIALLFANVAIFAGFKWGDALRPNDNKIQAAPALHPEIITVVSAPIGTVAIAPENALLNTASLACMEWSDFSGSDLVRASAVLGSLNLGEKLSSRPIEYTSGFWVYLAPLKDKAAVAKKVEQLKARGVAEYFVVQEPGEWLHAISLGVFKSEEAAQHHLTTLKELGVNSAKVGERASKLKATIFVFNQLDETVIEQLKTLQKDFPSSELKSVACRLPTPNPHA